MFESFIYHPEKGLKLGAGAGEMIEAIKDERSVIWIDMSDMEDADVDFLTLVFNLHPLTVEDFILPNIRPKIEEFKDYLFLVMFYLESANGNQASSVKTTEIDFCLGKNFLVTFHECPVNSLNICKDRIKKRSPMIQQGADMLLNSIIDYCVDSFIPFISEFDKHIDQLTDELFKDPKQEILKKIYLLKDQILNLRYTIGSQTDIVSLLAKNKFGVISYSAGIYFRNIYDNLMRLNDTIGAARDTITGAMEVYAFTVSNRLNEIMKTLTIIATIMMPLTLIASIYGMNFKHMPELESPLGYPIVITAMATVIVSMLVYFKRKKWL